MRVYVPLTARAQRLSRCMSRPGDVVLESYPVSGTLSEETEECLSDDARTRIAVDWAAHLLRVEEVTGERLHFVNSLYFDFLLPLAGLLGWLDGAIRRPDVDEIVLIGPSPRAAVPHLFVRSPDMPHGSHRYYAAAIAHHVLGVDWPVPVRVIRSDRVEWHALRPARSTIIRILSIIGSIRLVLRTFVVRARPTRTDISPSADVLILSRAPAQVRVAAGLSRQLESCGVTAVHLYQPQALQGSIRRVRSAVRELRAGGPAREFRIVSWVELVRALAASHLDAWVRRPVANTMRRSAALPGFHLQVASVNCEVQPLHYLRDYRACPVFVGASEALTRVLCRWRCSTPRLISFENYNRQAVLDETAAVRASAKHVVVQIVSLNLATMPRFPLSDCYFAESEATAAELRSVQKQAGVRVAYGGSLVDRSARTPADRFRLVFMTQPSDRDASAQLLDLLIATAARRDWDLSVRMHPRDLLSEYAPGVRRKLEDLFAEGDLDDVLSTASLVVARTSSVLMEAIARGVPVLACPISIVDRGLNAPFVRRIDGAGHVATCLEDVAVALDRPSDAYEESAEILWRHFFDADHSPLSSTLAEWVRS